MSVDSIISSPFIDFLRGQATKTRARNRQRGRTAANDRSYCALIDGMVFRVGGHRDRPRREIELIEERFRAAFVAAWRRIPGPDRRRLRQYWAGRDEPWRWESACPRPEIRVVAGDSGSAPPPACDRLGHRLTFDAAAAVEQPDRLQLHIAHALAQVWMLATKRHWGLYLEIVETPMERWARRMGKRADAAARESKLDLLEAAHRKAYETELEQRLRAWGFDGRVPEDVRVDRARGRDGV
jgi:hypothetical protein